MEYLKEYDQKPIEATKALGGGIPGFTGIFKKTKQINRMEKKGGIGLNVPAFFVFTKGGFHKLRRQEEVGRYPKNLTFCQLLYGRKCQLRGVGGQKKPESL